MFIYFYVFKKYGILNKQVAMAKQQVKLNRSELLPKVGVKGSYNYIHGLEVNDETFFYSYYVVLVWIRPASTTDVS